MSAADRAAIEAQRRELFAVVAVAALLAQAIDDQHVPAAELIARMADAVADALAGLAGGTK